MLGTSSALQEGTVDPQFFQVAFLAVRIFRLEVALDRHHLLGEHSFPFNPFRHLRARVGITFEFFS
jgi:hypothetical protein